MPTYTLRDIKSNNEWDVICSYDELQIILDEMPDVIKVLSVPKIISGTGGVLSKTDDGWKEQLARIHKGAGKNSNIKL